MKRIKMFLGLVGRYDHLGISRMGVQYAWWLAGHLTGDAGARE
jgi:hypothetical protein